MSSILIIAGENSGEKYGAALVHEFKRLEPSAAFYGTGGKRMAEQGVEILFPAEDLAVVGFQEVLSSLPRIRAIFKRIQAETERRKPTAAVLIDSPDFNLRLAKRLKRLSIPVLYYISPTVWAWRERRLKTIKEFVDKMLLIFPFEEEIYKKRGIPHAFVGHPLVEGLRATLSREEFFVKYGLAAQPKVIALLPGSRKSELRYHLPVLVKTMEFLRRAFPCQFLLVKAEGLEPDFIARLIPDRPDDFKILASDHYEALAYADLVLSACGTATLETALLGTPLIAFYRISPLSYFFGVRMMKIKDYSIVNILAEKPIIPELIQARFRPENLFAESKRVLESEEVRRKMREDFRKLRESLGESRASVNAARELARLAAKPRPGAAA